MDEIKYTEKKTKKKNSNEPDWFLTVTTVQIIMCVVVAVTVFLISSSNGENAQKLHNDYSNLMNYSIETSDIQNVFAELKNRILKKNGDSSLSDVSGTSSDEETSGNGEPGESASQPPSSDEEKKESEKTTEETTEGITTEPTSEKTEPTKSVMASGGEDISLYSAKENTSFSPVATTCPIVRPVDGGWYSSYFGYRINPITNENSFHTGLDIAVAQGSNIHAAYGGRVRLVGEDDHSGKYILLSHSDGFETFYCHCSEIIAEEGANIRSGETIAKVGSTGWSTGPHLHFEVRKNGERLDPLRLLENDG